MYVADPAITFPLDPDGVSTSSKAIVPTTNTLFFCIFILFVGIQGLRFECLFFLMLQLPFYHSSRFVGVDCVL